MPLPSQRLDILLVPSDPDRVWESEAKEAVMRTLQEFGGLSVVRVRLDHPGRGVLYGNQQGGFGVCCPVDGRPMAAGVSEALRQWEATGRRTMSCGCGLQHELEDMQYRPPAAPGRCAVVLEDVNSYVIEDVCIERLRERLGSFRVVARRVG